VPTPVRSGARRRSGTWPLAAVTSARSETASRDARQLSPRSAAAAIAEAWVAQSRARASGNPAVSRRAAGELAQPVARRAISAAAERILTTSTHVPAGRCRVASHPRPRSVRVPLMPMLHGCGFQGCSTFTLSTYCVEHELLVRASKESERLHGATSDLTADAPLTAAVGEEAQQQEEQPAAL